MEETRKDGSLPAEHSAYLPEGTVVENNPASEPTPQQAAEPASEPASEPAQPAAAKPAAHGQQPRRGKKCGFSMGKVFLASLGAVVVGSVLSVVFWLILFSGIGSMFGSTEKKTIPAEAILHIDLAESILDAPSKDPMASIDLMTMSPISQLTLFDALRALEAAAEDDRIKGIYINFTGAGSASLPILEELREGIERFKQSGKWVVAYNDTYSQGGYYLASVADKIYMMEDYLIHDVTEKSKNICNSYNVDTVLPSPANWLQCRTLYSDRFSSYPEGSGTEKLEVSDMGFVIIGDEKIDVRGLHDIVSPRQLDTLGFMLRYLEILNSDRKIDIEKKIDDLYARIEEEGIDFLYSSFFTTCERFLDLPRKQELMALINRMRKINIAKEGDNYT